MTYNCHDQADFPTERRCRFSLDIKLDVLQGRSGRGDREQSVPQSVTEVSLSAALSPRPFGFSFYLINSIEQRPS